MSRQSLNTSNALRSNNYEPNHQKTALSNEYSDDDEEYQTESDSEYETINITGWGDNAENEEVSWNTLVDPSVKVKAGGVGSGNLHRRGGNFKPLSEAAILAQRLSKGVPSKKSASKPKRPKKKKSATVPQPAPAELFAGRKNRPYVSLVRPSVPARAPIKNPSASTWGSVPLSETPFWEKKQEPPNPTASVAPPDPSQTQPLIHQFNQLNISQNVQVTKPLESKLSEQNAFHTIPSKESEKPLEIIYSLNSSIVQRKPTLTSENLPAYSVPPKEPFIKEELLTPPPTTTTNTTATTTATRWNIEAQGFDPTKGFNSDLKPDALKWDISVPSFVPSAISTSTSSSANSSPLVYNADAPVFVPTFVPPPPVKKILKITSPAAKEEPLLSHSAQEHKPRVHLDQSLIRKHLDFKPSAGQSCLQTEKPAIEVQPQFQSRSFDQNQLESQTQPESTRGFESEPFLRINLDIAEGISTTILVQEGSNPDDLAEEFGITHRLKITAKAKKSMSSFIATLIEKKVNERKHGLVD
ncbi:hypothetical protein INT46_000647 [Mucor plumbeus]|uniref:Uncharacterized protein n=1 Tax=Mucor plumbeus TaxID=97098 RepID=A0A8H7QQ69_9FUNG|nr:hypothetical protein INT46_000647 [Mucor plumbeus]